MTKVSLRKAKALQNSLQEAITENGYAIDTDIQISEFEDHLKKEASLKAEFSAALSRRGSLLDAVYEIRAMVGAANSASRIDELLCALAKLEKDITLFQVLAKTQPKLENNVIAGMLMKIRNREESSSHHRQSDFVSTTIFDPAEIEKIKWRLAKMKKLKQDVQDQLLELNVQTEITLSSSTTETLKAESIL
tara:strand:- start:1043 stop:1618 length:576 start_codon:yes stop_codon:yes gene_type:complete